MRLRPVLTVEQKQRLAAELAEAVQAYQMGQGEIPDVADFEELDLSAMTDAMLGIYHEALIQHERYTLPVLIEMAHGEYTRRHPVKPPTRVEHKKFGQGTVTHVDGGKLTVNFDDVGKKVVLRTFVDEVIA